MYFKIITKNKKNKKSNYKNLNKLNKKDYIFDF